MGVQSILRWPVLGGRFVKLQHPTPWECSRDCIEFRRAGGHLEGFPHRLLRQFGFFLSSYFALASTRGIVWMVVAGSFRVLCPIEIYVFDSEF